MSSNVGEIYSIVAGQMTDFYAEPTELLGRLLLLEAVPEITSKKIRFCGSSIKPRDVFDIAAVSEAGQRGHPLS